MMSLYYNPKIKWIINNILKNIYWIFLKKKYKKKVRELNILFSLGHDTFYASKIYMEGSQTATPFVVLYQIFYVQALKYLICVQTYL